MTEDFKCYKFVHIMSLLNTVVGERFFFPTGNISFLTPGIKPFFWRRDLVCCQLEMLMTKTFFRLSCHALFLAARSGFCMPFSVRGQHAGCCTYVTVQRNFFQCECSGLLGLHSDWSEERALCLMSFQSSKQA